jgi:hypothetical protein
VTSVVPVRDVQLETGRGARFDAKGGTDVIITGRNFGDVEESHGKVVLGGVDCNNVLFIRDSEVRCTLPGNQVVGNGSLVVLTWNPSLPNGSDSSRWQASTPFDVLVQCPEGYFGRQNEVRGVQYHDYVRVCWISASSPMSASVHTVVSAELLCTCFRLWLAGRPALAAPWRQPATEGLRSLWPGPASTKLTA